MSRTQPPESFRRDPQQRLLCRFYEPLILLLTLGKTRDNHTLSDLPRSSDFLKWPLKFLRRLFLHELAFVCDYKKGGDTVAAIGLETTPEKKIFWIAANSCPAQKIVPFLRQLLARLKTIADNPANTKEGVEEVVEEIAKSCIEFGTHRIKAYRKFLGTHTAKCLSDLSTKTPGTSDCK
jgi:hypothetical protein